MQRNRCDNNILLYYIIYLYHIEQLRLCSSHSVKYFAYSTKGLSQAALHRNAFRLDKYSALEEYPIAAVFVLTRVGLTF